MTFSATITFLLVNFMDFPGLVAEKPQQQQNQEQLPQPPDTGTPGGESIPGGTRNPDGVESYLSKQVFNLENQWEGVYEKYFDNDFSSLSLTPENIADKLTELSEKTGKRSAVVWINSTPDYLALYIVTPGKPAMGIRVPEGNREELFKIIKQFHQQIQSPQSSAYLKTAQDLHKIMIQPIKYHLLRENIDTLILCIGPKLRSFPFAALHDGENFLIENYALTRIPGFNLTNWDYKKLDNTQMLAMGASEFADNKPLPGVAAELSTIVPQVWQGRSFLNEEFTVSNLRKQRQNYPYPIVHLATHAQFNPGDPRNSYIQFSDTRLHLRQMKSLDWNKPPVNLLVLSACDTALGDINAELGFVGLALQSGIDSALGSLWRASDIGTVGIMSEFYWQLKENSLKAEALRQAQIAMIKKQIRWGEGQLETPREAISITSEEMKLENLDLSHPYYWSGFSLVGNPF
ncbi:CHAT domain-containing protein [Crocosphaera sp. Alani8]|uniref:CHAT domain-containing protein n=1 Tax=Crocosphaera sp. Alani8 TaxID=3038952 RepID=UPI00313E380D